jgi:hypothetical protein
MAALSIMDTVRRRLASCALALTMLQGALLFAAPLSACCRLVSARTDAAAARTAEKSDCCPPGSHPPGQCPLHRQSRTAARPDCRMTCEATPAAFLIGTVGVLPVPAALELPSASSALHGASFAVPIPDSVLPDAPPPKLL